MLYVIVLVCSVSNPVCNEKTARAYQAFTAPPGVIVCGVPATLTIIQSATAPTEREYIRQRCELRPY